jgi:hypothetical protein
MKKSLPIIIVLIVIVLALVGWFVWGKGETVTPGGDQQVTEEQTQGESFSGKIKDAFMKNVPLKCTYKMDDNNFGTGWIKNKRYYGEITANGKQGFIILVDNCMWTWNKDEKDMGVKMCFAEQQDEDFWDSFEESQQNGDYNYNCTASVVNDAVFTPPADVKFTDIDALMDQATQGTEQPSQTTVEVEEE